MTYMPPFSPDGAASGSGSGSIEDFPDHGWIVSHMISLIGYCETEGLAEAERILTEATERLAPILNGHRLARLRECPAGAVEERHSGAAHLLEMPFARVARPDARM